MTTMTIPTTPAFRAFRLWLKGIARTQRFGLIRTSEGDDFIVVRPEQIAELDAILSDPAFLAVVESGVSDVALRRVKRVKRGLTLRHAAEGTLPCDSSMAVAVEKGVKDVLAGKVSKLRKGQTLQNLL